MKTILADVGREGAAVWADIAKGIDVLDVTYRCTGKDRNVSRGFILRRR